MFKMGFVIFTLVVLVKSVAVKVVVFVTNLSLLVYSGKCFMVSVNLGT